MFQDLSTLIQIFSSWFNWPPWCYSLFYKFENGMLYNMTFTLKAPIRRFLSVWFSVLGKYRRFKGTAAQKPHYDRSHRKRTPEFLNEIQIMIDIDPYESIRSIARDMRVSEFLIRLILHKDMRCFLYKMRKGKKLSYAMKTTF